MSKKITIGLRSGKAVAITTTDELAKKLDVRLREIVLINKDEDSMINIDLAEFMPKCNTEHLVLDAGRIELICVESITELAVPSKNIRLPN